MKNLNVLLLKLYWSNTHEIKSKYKFNLYFTFEIINIHNRPCRKLLFLPLLNPFFIIATYRRFSTGTPRARKQYARTKICFSVKIKDQIILFELEGILKSNLRLFKLDSKTLLVYNYPSLGKFWEFFCLTCSKF